MKAETLEHAEGVATLEPPQALEHADGVETGSVATVKPARGAAVDLTTALRARLTQMADDHYAMQEDILKIPARRVPMLMMVLEHHAHQMSKLATRLLALEAAATTGTMEHAEGVETLEPPQALEHADGVGTLALED